MSLIGATVGNYEITVAREGVPEAVRTASSTIDPAMATCIDRAFARHRWDGFDARILVVPLKFVTQ